MMPFLLKFFHKAKDRQIHLLFALILIYAVFFLPALNGIGQYWDWNFPYFQDHLLNVFSRISSSWYEQDFGRPMGYATDIYFRWLIAHAGFIPVVYLPYLILVCLFSLGSFGIFLILRRSSGANIAFLAAILAFINPVASYKVLAGHLNYIVSLVIFIYLVYYTLNVYEKTSVYKSVVMGLLLAFIGAQVQFFILAGLFLGVYLLLDRSKFSIQSVLIMFFIILGINLVWLMNFIVGAVNLAGASSAAGKVSFPESTLVSYADVWNFSLAKATQIDRLYPPLVQIAIQFLSVLAVAISVLIPARLCHQQRFIVLLFSVFFFLLFAMVVHFGNFWDIPLVSIFYPMFREAGHFGWLMWLCLVVLLSFLPLLNVRTGLVIALLVSAIGVNGLYMRKHLPLNDVHSAQKTFAPFKKYLDENSNSRILFYPFFDQYSFLNASSSFSADGFPLSNVGHDSFSLFLNNPYVNNSVPPYQFQDSLQYKLLKTLDLTILRPYNVQYLVDLSGTYQSNYDRYVPPATYKNELSVIKNNSRFISDLLEKNALNMKQVAPDIYKLVENDNAISAFTQLYNFPNGRPDEATRLRVSDALALAADTPWTSGVSPTVATWNLYPLFNEIATRTIVTSNFSDSAAPHPVTLWSSNAGRDFLFEFKDDQLSVSAITVPLKINAATVESLDEDKVQVMTLPIQEDNKLLLSFAGKIYRIENGQSVLISPQDQDMEVYIEEPNILLNGNFSDGFWQNKVMDCNAFDTNPDISMSTGTIPASRITYLQLEASRHVACTSQKKAVIPSSKYLLSLDYRTNSANSAGFYLDFGGEDNLHFADRITGNASDWRTNTSLISIPKEVSTTTLYLYAYPQADATSGVAQYTKVSLQPLRHLATLALEINDDSYNKSVVLMPGGTSTITWMKSDSVENLITNGDFSNGLWSDTVSDCNKYDDAPDIAINAHEIADDENSPSLQLQARRHIACTSQSFRVYPGLFYIDFDAQSSVGSVSSYFIGFNDSKESFVSDMMPHAGNSWLKYSKVFSIPASTTLANLYLYARPTEDNSTTTTRYDNIVVRPAVDLRGNYFIQTEPASGTLLVNPRNVSFSGILSTLRSVHIAGATTPFYLAFSESFHPQWQLMLNNALVNKGLARYSPWAMPNRVGDDAHFALDDFLNGWYVDPVALCAIDTAKEAPLAAAAQAKAQAAARALGTSASTTANAATSSSLNLTPVQQYGVRPRQNVGLSNSSTSTPPTSQSNSIAFSVNTPESTTSARSTATTTSKTKTASSSASTTASAPASATTSDSSPKTSVTASAESDRAPLTSLAPNGVRPLQNVDLSNTAITVFATSTPAADQSNMREGCIRNEDGSYDIEMIIEFWPQRWFYVGLVISGTTLFLCLLYLLVVGIRSLVRRFNPRAQRAKAAAERTAAELQTKASVVEFMPEYQAGPTRAPAQSGLVLAPVWNRTTSDMLPSRSAMAAAVRAQSLRGGEATEQDFAIRGVSDFFLVMARGVYIAWRRVARRPLRMVIVLAVAGAAGWYWGISAGLLWGLFMFFALYRLDSRVVGSLAIVTLVACPVLLSLGSEWGDTTAEEVAVYAYFFLVMTVVLQILEYRRQAKREARLASRQGL